MSDQRLFNDQSLTRAIRKAIAKFNSLPDEDINGKLQCVMAVASLGAVGLIGDKHMAVSTIAYVEGTLSH